MTMPRYYMEGVLMYSNHYEIEAANKEEAEYKFLHALSKSLVFMSTPDKDGREPSFVLDDGYTDIEVCEELPEIEHYDYTQENENA
jgi:hypothetical protein